MTIRYLRTARITAFMLALCTSATAGDRVPMRDGSAAPAIGEAVPDGPISALLDHLAAGAETAVPWAGVVPAPPPASPAPFADDAAPAGAPSRVAGFTPVPVPRPATAPRRLAPVVPSPFVPTTAAPSLEAMIGQMLMIGFRGGDVGEAGPARIAAHIRAGRLGGVIVFRQNVTSGAAVRRLTAAFAAASPPNRPVLVAVDQEGGRVQRLTRRVGFPETPAAAVVAARGAAAAGPIYTRLAQDLARWGFNTNLGPVVDLGGTRDNPIITRLGRAYSGKPGEVAAFARTFVDAHRAAGVLTALKHFPGHGSSRGDTHKGFVDVSYSWRERELDPFRALIAGDRADMVMVAHVTLDRYSRPDTPASLSPALIEGLLRDELGFRGVVISDDLEMGAITQLGAPVDIAERAILAGNDILVFAGDAAGRGDLVAVLHRRLAEAARDPIVLARIRESYARIMAMKARLPR